MDINGTRFHLLHGADTWQTLIDRKGSSNLEVHDCYEALILRRKLFRFPTSPEDIPQSDGPPGLNNRRGAARDRYGNWYWIAEDEQEIRFLSPSQRQDQHFWSGSDFEQKPERKGKDFHTDHQPHEYEITKLRGLVVTQHHYLVVGTLEPAGLLVFDLHAGGTPIHMVWPEQVAFQPFDLAPRPEGGVWILDLPPSSQSDGDCRYWALDRDFQVEGLGQQNADLRESETDLFQPVSGNGRGVPGRKFPLGISIALSSPLPGIQPIALEALPDDTVLILAQGVDQSIVYRYRFAEELGRFQLNAPIESESEIVDSHSLKIQGYDLAFVQDKNAKKSENKGILYIVEKNGDQVYAFIPSFQEDSLSLQLIPKYYPLRRFSGKGLVAAMAGVSQDDQTAYYDLGNRWLPVVAYHKPRHDIKGLVETDLFDGKEPDCIWHRIILDGVIPNGTKIKIESRAANSRDLVLAAPWQAEPDLYRRNDGPELPYYRPYSADQLKKEGTGSWELLFQHATGRYLQLRMSLKGTGVNTPEIHTLRVYYPRFSYLTEYLPRVFQEDQGSASFLDRYLANLEGMYTTLEGRITNAQQLFDIRLIDKELLDWLATWFGICLDPSWSEYRQRLFLEHAVELFKQRGTLAGLIRTIRLALDPCIDESLFSDDVTSYLYPDRSTQFYPFSIRIVERYLFRSAPGVVFGDQSQPEIPRLVKETEPWTPAMGSEPLHERFRNYLEILYGDSTQKESILSDLQIASFNELSLSPIKPENSTLYSAWKKFIKHEIGFTYAVITLKDEPLYQSFLKHRYRQIDRLNQAYQEDFNSFSSIRLPTEDGMPEGGSKLYDWIQFVSLIKPIQQHAHQFTVLVPIDFESDSLSQIAKRVGLARRIVNIEKPSHTDFDVQPYWALFRVGEARVGMDTLLGRGSRFTALILGHSQIAEAYLGAAHPWDVTDRIITGRDSLGSEMAL